MWIVQQTSVALGRKPEAQDSTAAQEFSFSSKLRLSRESEDILPFFSILLAFLEDAEVLLYLLLQDFLCQLYTVLPGT